jgi:hypothetical protein
MNVQKSDLLNQSEQFSRQRAREWATKLQTDYNWAEVLLQLNKLKVNFRDQVWKFWQLDMFGESDFPSELKAEETQKGGSIHNTKLEKATFFN